MHASRLSVTASVNVSDTFRSFTKLPCSTNCADGPKNPFPTPNAPQLSQCMVTWVPALDPSSQQHGRPNVRNLC